MTSRYPRVNHLVPAAGLVIGGALVIAASGPQIYFPSAPAEIEPYDPEFDPKPITEQPSAPPPEIEVGEPSSLMETAGLALLIILIIAILTGIALALWQARLPGFRWVRRRRLDPANTQVVRTTATLSEEVTAGAEKALADLSLSASDRVIATWLELENAVLEYVPARQAHITPAAWARAHLSDAGAPTAAIDELVDLYYRTRFRPGTVSGQREVERAGQCLRAIREGITASPAATTAGSDQEVIPS